MAYTLTDLVTVQSLKNALSRTKTEYLSAIVENGGATFKTVESIPEVADAEENVLYLVKNAESGYYDIYAIINDTMEWLDNTSVNLDGYVTTDDLESAVSVATDEEISEMLDEVFGA